jgi:hypothetical protein
MKKLNCRDHALVVSKNQESRIKSNRKCQPQLSCFVQMEKDVGTRVTRSIYNKKNTTVTLEQWCHPQKISKAAWNCSQQFHPMISNWLHKNGAQVFTPMEPSRKSPTKWHHKKGSLRQHNASYKCNHGSKPTLKLPLGVSWVRPKLGIQCSQISLFYPLAYWNLSMKQGSLLFCFVCTYEIHWTGMLQLAFLVSLDSSGGQVHWLGFMAVGLVV